jgi:hypothetical protein
MGTFTTPLFLEYGDGHDWKVTHAFPYEHDDGRVFTVPAGFETDFASVPRFFWRIFPPHGRYGKAAVLHDFLYRTGAVARRDADHIFFDAMHELGVRFFTRWTIWSAVRTFGWFAYRANTK